jgi:hypothetical protein
MKNLLNFGVSDPLTLGMAHPVADRLERLGRAKPISTLSRMTAFGFIGVVATLTAPFSIAGETLAVDSSHAMELWFVPDREAMYMEELERRLEAVRRGLQEQTYVTEWKGDGTGTLRENQIYVYVSGTDDKITLETTDANGKRIPRLNAAEVVAAVEPELMKCVEQTGISKLPLTFQTSLDIVPEYALAGPHTVRCTPGDKAARAALTNDQELEGLRQSPEIKEEQRLAMMRGIKARGLREAFAKKNPNPTRQEKYDHCIDKFTILDREYNFLGHQAKSDEEILKACDKLDAREYSISE